MSNKRGYDLRRRALTSHGVIGTDKLSCFGVLSSSGVLTKRSAKYIAQLKNSNTHSKITLMISNGSWAYGGRGSAALDCGA